MPSNVPSSSISPSTSPSEGPSLSQVPSKSPTSQPTTAEPSTQPSLSGPDCIALCSEPGARGDFTLHENANMQGAVGRWRSNPYETYGEVINCWNTSKGEFTILIV